MEVNKPEDSPTSGHSECGSGVLNQVGGVGGLFVGDAFADTLDHLRDGRLDQGANSSKVGSAVFLRIGSQGMNVR